MRMLRTFKQFRNLTKMNSANPRGVQGFPARRLDSEMVVMMSIESEFEAGASTQSNKDLIANLNSAQKKVLEERIPWFQSSMPASYFRQIPPERRMQHLISVVAVPDINRVPQIASYEYFNENESNQDLKRISILSSGKQLVGKLADQVSKLPTETQLQSLNLYTSDDNLLAITEFRMQQQDGSLSARKPNEGLSTSLQAYVDEIVAGKHEEMAAKYLENSGEVMHASMKNITAEKVREFVQLEQNALEDRLTPRRFLKVVEMYNELLRVGIDETIIDVESNWGAYPEKTLYTLAVANVIIKTTLTRVCRYMESRGMNIERAHLDEVKGPSGDISLIRFLVSPRQPEDGGCKLGAELDATKAEIKEFLPLVAKWYDDRIMDLIADPKYRSLSPVNAEIVVGLLDCCHLVMSRVPEDMYEFSRANVFSVMERPQLMEIVDLFKRKFYANEDFDLQAATDKIKESVRTYVENEMHADVLMKLIEIVHTTKRTNLSNRNRFAFGIKLDPVVAMTSKDKNRVETPFGMFYVNGRRFTGMQLRFREIARGGLRLVTPGSKEVFNIESTRQFNECYDLAFAQQLKNKDIPEGGSKAVCLVNMDDLKSQSRDHIVDKSLRAFVNSVLDIMVQDKDNNELIFFGPDEQVTVDHINWMITRAMERDYIMPTAFMSSKPEQGINHKEYGVTSEGVAVFADVAMKQLKVLESEKGYFTVKITGGTDGDVAGNMLKILNREYGDKCRVVGLADGTACLENPNGLSWDELLRLVKENLPLSGFDAQKDPSSTVYLLDKAEGVQKRNTLHNRVESDVFIPGGGRPATINDNNWRHFLNKDGVPSSRLIVEGANLFLTSGARKNLGKEGVVIVKDSSANKCGVMCSSFEIISCMMLEKDEFLAMKPKLVSEVLQKLKTAAQKEAELLLREYKKNVSSDFKKTEYNLVDTSIEVSYALNKTVDAVRVYLQENDVDLDQFDHLIREYLPESLVEYGFTKGRFKERVPKVYQLNMVSTIIAGELVYFEGLDFMRNVHDTFTGTELAELAIKYSRSRDEVNGLIIGLEGGQLSQEEMSQAISLLKKGGARSALGF